jgi:hypothetical protein
MTFCQDPTYFFVQIPIQDTRATIIPFLAYLLSYFGKRASRSSRIVEQKLVAEDSDVELCQKGCPI